MSNPVDFQTVINYSGVGGGGWGRGSLVSNDTMHIPSSNPVSGRKKAELTCY